MINNKEPLLINEKYNYDTITVLGVYIAFSCIIICSTFIVFIYKDIHNMYNLINNNPYNITELKQNIEFINYCISEKYCKRI